MRHPVSDQDPRHQRPEHHGFRPGQREQSRHHGQGFKPSLHYGQKSPGQERRGYGFGHDLPRVSQKKWLDQEKTDCPSRADPPGPDRDPGYRIPRESRRHRGNQSCQNQVELGGKGKGQGHQRTPGQAQKKSRLLRCVARNQVVGHLLVPGQSAAGHGKNRGYGKGDKSGQNLRRFQPGRVRGEHGASLSKPR